MKEVFRLVAAAMAASVAVVGWAQTTSATAKIHLVSQSGSSYNYDIDLKNNGTVALETFWYAWVPGDFYLTAMPTNIGSPAFWSGADMAALGGHSVQWVTDSTWALAAGASLDGFTFTSTEAPSVLFGNSTLGNKAAVGSSVVYTGQPFQGSSHTFVVAPVPEPASFFGMGAGFVGLLVLRRRRNC